jgi:outer membrane protein
MRSFLRVLLSAVLLLALTSVPALAQTKIATVDLKKIFYGYYKTRLATQAVQDRAGDLDKDYTNMANDLKKRSDQYEQLLESASDPAVSDDERVRRKSSADDQLKQLQDSKAAIDQFERQAQMTINDQKQRMHDNILDEIKKAVAEKAKAGGYTLVFDSTAETISGTPSIIYSAGDNDLTDDVLKNLNASAPPDLPDTSSSPSVFMSTNTLPYGATPGGALPGSQ